MKDAFIVFLYAYNKARGLTLESIPELEAIFVRRIPMPGKPELRGIVDADLVGEDLINAAYLNIPVVGTYISTAAFRNAAVAIHKGQLWHRELYATREHYIQRGLMEQMTGRFYCDYPCTLEDDVLNYEQWFQDRGLDVPTFSELEADLLAIQILSFATGANLKVSQSLKDMQGAMLRMMAQLSSYSVQYLQSINTDPIKVIDWPVIRVGDADVHGADHVLVDAIDTRVEDISARGHTLEPLPLDEVGVVWNYDIRMHSSGYLDISLDCSMVGKLTIRDRIDIRPIDIINVVEPLDILGDDTPDTISDEYVPGNLAPLSGAFTGFQSPHYSLTQLELDEIQARWAAWVLIHGEPSLPLANAIPNDDLDGIDYPELALINDTILDGFDPPVALDIGTVDLPGIDYPELVAIDEEVLDGFDPPSAIVIGDVDLPGIDYPTLADITTPTLGGLVDPTEEINNLNMGGLNYPP